MSAKEFFFDSYDKRAWSVISQSPEDEKLFYFPDERTCSSQVTEHNERTSSPVLSSSLEWKDLIDSLTKFVIGYGDFKADRKIPGHISEEVGISFTVCNDLLNHARLVSYTHSFWYLEFVKCDALGLNVS
jgi:hypothetical protein